MTQSDKDFITRIQVSQLVTPDPYADDFYAQVYGAILRSRLGVQTQDDRVLKFGSGGGVGLGLGQKGPGRRQSAMQRMEAQVERIVNNARMREKEKICAILIYIGDYELIFSSQHSTTFKARWVRLPGGATKPPQGSFSRWIQGPRPRPLQSLPMVIYLKQTPFTMRPRARRRKLQRLVARLSAAPHT